MRYSISFEEKKQGEKHIDDIRSALKQRRPNLRLAMQDLVKLYNIFLNMREES